MGAFKGYYDNQRIRDLNNLYISLLKCNNRISRISYVGHNVYWLTICENDDWFGKMIESYIISPQRGPK